ncbi:MAG: hypothetical protein ACKVKC_09940, partial [Rhodobacterales bacterium]
AVLIMQKGGSLGQGLLSPIHINEGRKAMYLGPRTKCRAPRTSGIGPLRLVGWVHWGGVLFVNCISTHAPISI